MNRAHVRTLRPFARVAAVALTFLAACKGAEQTSGDTGGTMIVVVPAEPRSLFAPTELGTQSTAVIAQLFDRLAEIGQDLNTIGERGFTPRLASSWRWASDSLSIAFTIDSAARWHDGKPVVAEDVRYTYRTYVSDAVGSPTRALLGNIDSVSVKDPHTAVVWFKRRTPQQFFDATYHMFILPSHLLSSVPDSALASSDFARKPVGTGRFRFGRWDAGERIEILADTANYRGRAKLDRVIFSKTSDPGAARVKLFAGEADFYEQIPRDNIEQVAASPTLRLVTSPSLVYNFLGLNLRDPKSLERPHPVLGDPSVRRALVLAVDRDRLVRSIFDSLGSVSIGPAPRVLFPDTSSFKRPTYSLEHARALLDSAGWMETKPDGVRAKNGVRLAFEILTATSSVPRQRAAVQLQEQYRAVGADVTLQTLEPNLMGDRVAAGNFDSFIGGFGATPGLLGTPTAWGSKGPQNFLHYSNPQFDKALEIALSSFDETRSKTELARAFEIIWNDAPAVWLFDPKIPVAIHKRIRNTSIRADGWYFGLADWSVDPAQRIDRDKIGLREDSKR